MRNLLYGAKGTGLVGSQAQIRFDEAIDLHGLAALLDRSPQNLSGGERVAIGRALLSQPTFAISALYTTP